MDIAAVSPRATVATLERYPMRPTVAMPEAPPRTYTGRFPSSRPLSASTTPRGTATSRPNSARTSADASRPVLALPGDTAVLSQILAVPPPPLPAPAHHVAQYSTFDVEAIVQNVSAGLQEAFLQSLQSVEHQYERKLHRLYHVMRERGSGAEALDFHGCMALVDATERTEFEPLDGNTQQHGALAHKATGAAAGDSGSSAHALVRLERQFARLSTKHDAQFRRIDQGIKDTSSRIRSSLHQLTAAEAADAQDLANTLSMDALGRLLSRHIVAAPTPTAAAAARAADGEGQPPPKRDTSMVSKPQQPVAAATTNSFVGRRRSSGRRVTVASTPSAKSLTSVSSIADANKAALTAAPNHGAAAPTNAAAAVTVSAADPSEPWSFNEIQLALDRMSKSADKVLATTLDPRIAADVVNERRRAILRLLNRERAMPKTVMDITAATEQLSGDLFVHPESGKYCFTVGTQCDPPPPPPVDEASATREHHGGADRSHSVPPNHVTAAGGFLIPQLRTEDLSQVAAVGTTPSVGAADGTPFLHDSPTFGVKVGVTPFSEGSEANSPSGSHHPHHSQQYVHQSGQSYTSRSPCRMVDEAVQVTVERIEAQYATMQLHNRSFRGGGPLMDGGDSPHMMTTSSSSQHRGSMLYGESMEARGGGKGAVMMGSSMLQDLAPMASSVVIEADDRTASIAATTDLVPQQFPARPGRGLPPSPAMQHSNAASPEHDPPAPMRSGVARSLMRRASEVSVTSSDAPSPTRGGSAAAASWSRVKRKIVLRDVEIDASDQTQPLEGLMARERRVDIVNRNFERLFFTLSTAANSLALYAEGLEGDLTCRCCFQTLEAPTVLWPCGHSFCHKCVEREMGTLDGTTGDRLYVCRDCGARCHEGHTHNVTLGSIASRWNFKRRTVGEPSALIGSLRHAFAESIAEDETGVLADFAKNVMHPPLVL